MMRRVTEPELMRAEAQARAYAGANFESAHSAYPRLFAERFPDAPRRARVLDLGCGPCDVTLRFARLFPEWRFDALDGSAAMLRYARRALARQPALAKRIRLIQGRIGAVRLPRRAYDVILATSLLHHLHDPQRLWAVVQRHARPGTCVFIADLRRPGSRKRARALTRRYAAGEPAVLQRDFFNSLLAAFTPEEVRAQLREAGLTELEVEPIGNRHLIVFGRITGAERITSPG